MQYKFHTAKVLTDIMLLFFFKKTCVLWVKGNAKAGHSLILEDIMNKISKCLTFRTKNFQSSEYT